MTEDDDENADLYTGWLKAQPYDVARAATLEDAGTLAGSFRPDVVVLDVHLPDLNGLEMLRRLRALDARNPVVFISGRGDADDAIEAMKLGAYDYLLKPLELRQVREALLHRAPLRRRHVRVCDVV